MLLEKPGGSSEVAELGRAAEGLVEELRGQGEAAVKKHDGRGKASSVVQSLKITSVGESVSFHEIDGAWSIFDGNEKLKSGLHLRFFQCLLHVLAELLLLRSISRPRSATRHLNGLRYA